MDSDKGLVHFRTEIIWTNHNLSIRPFWTNFSYSLVKNASIFFHTNAYKMSSSICQLLCSGLNMLTRQYKHKKIMTVYIIPVGKTVDKWECIITFQQNKNGGHNRQFIHYFALPLPKNLWPGQPQYLLSCQTQGVGFVTTKKLRYCLKLLAMASLHPCIKANTPMIFSDKHIITHFKQNIA